MMSHSVDLLAWSCLFIALESKPGPILPPQNVSLLWITGFQPRLSWVPPQHLGANCTYEVFLKTKKGRERYLTENLEEQFYIVMEGGFLNMSVRTVCDRRSELAWVSVDNAELVRKLQCFIYSATRTRCSWQKAGRARDLRFFYRLLNNNFSESGRKKVLIRECSSYTEVRTGCDLEANINQSIHIWFNGTVNNTLATNTFKKNTSNDVRLPALNWTVTKTQDKFLISWTPPEIERRWKFEINYTECSETKSKTVDGGTSTELDRVPHCPYRMAMKAFMKGGQTPFSDEVYFDSDPSAWLYAAIIIPVMLAGLAALVLVCCRKNKEYMFPKVPEPRDLLSDISDNNNKSADHTLCVPAEEDDNCRISVVVDPLINQLDTSRPLDSAKAPQTSRPLDSAKAPQTSQPLDSAKAPQTSRPLDSAKAPQTSRPLDSAKAPQTSRPLDSAKAPQTSRPLDSAKAPQTSRPLDSAKAPQTSRPLDSAKAPQTSRPLDSAKAPQTSRPLDSAKAPQTSRPLDSAKAPQTSRPLDSAKAPQTSRPLDSAKAPQTSRPLDSAKAPQTSRPLDSAKAPQTSRPLDSAKAPQTSRPLDSAKAPQTSRPLDSAKATQTSRPLDSAKAPQTSRPLDSAKAPQTSRPLDSAKAPQTSRPLDSAKAPQTSRPLDSAKAPQTSRPLDSAKAPQTSRPLDSAKAPQTSRPLDSAKAPQTSRPLDSAKAPQTSRPLDSAKAPQTSRPLDSAKAPQTSRPLDSAKAPQTSRPLDSAKAPQVLCPMLAQQKRAGP